VEVKPNQLALLAAAPTITAALVAATASITVALVNARAQASLSRVQAVREHRMKEVEPLLQVLEEQAATMQRLLFAVAFDRRDMLNRAEGSEHAIVGANLRLAGLGTEIGDRAVTAAEVMAAANSLVIDYSPVRLRGEPLPSGVQDKILRAAGQITFAMKALRTAVDNYVFEE
jgi:hypothetical protein